MGSCWNLTINYGVCCNVTLPIGYGHLTLCTYLTNTLYMLKNKCVFCEVRGIVLYIMKRVRKIVEWDYCLNHVCPSVFPQGTTWLQNGRIFIKFDILAFFENLSRKVKFHSNLTKITGSLHEDRYTLLIISRLFLLRMKNVSDKRCRENQNTHFVFSNLKKSRAFYEIMRKNVEERGRLQMAIWRMRIACRIAKATNTLTTSNTYCFSTATMHERASMLRHTYSASVVKTKIALYCIKRSSPYRAVNTPSRL